MTSPRVVIEGSYILGNNVGIYLYNSTGYVICNNVLDDWQDVQIVDAWAYWNLSLSPAGT